MAEATLSGPAAAATATASAPIRFRYHREAPARLLDRRNTLAVVAFDEATPAAGDPRLVTMPLRLLLPEGGTPPVEVWQVEGEVRHGRDGDLAWAQGGGYLMLSLRVDETRHGGPAGAAEHAYARLAAGARVHGYEHWLRAWNYLAAINDGEGDEERYRQFSQGRARGIAGLAPERFPAATAIGRLDGRAELVVYALFGRNAGVPVENPRQVSAWRYPRQYGPTPPSFARAMRLGTRPATLLISGTASVVGHRTVHDQARRQMQETLLNLQALVRAGGVASDDSPARPLGGNEHSFKLYVRDAADAGRLLPLLEQAGITRQQLLVLAGHICRQDLLVEIDGVMVAAGDSGPASLA